MTLYFIASSDAAIGTISRGTKVAWNGSASAEFDAWRTANAGQIIPVPLHPAEAGAALTRGVIDIYVTTIMAEALRVANWMPTAFIYDQVGTIIYAEEGPVTPSPTDPVIETTPTEVIIRSELNIDSPKQLDGAIIAAVKGSATELTAARFFKEIGVDVNFVVFTTSTEAINAYAAGRADALAVADGYGARIAAQYLGGTSGFDIIDLTIGAAIPAPDHVKNVALLYEAGFAREADIGGLNYWIDRHEAGMDLVTMGAHFLDSDEFTLRFGDDDGMGAAQFVDLLYQNVLERPGEAAGVEYWQGRMNAGTSREIVLLEFAASPENVEASTVGLLAETAPGYWSFG